MRNQFIYLCFLASIFYCCAQNSNRVYFNIDPEDRKIVIPVRLNDSIIVNLAFDTGWSDKSIFLDSSFVAAHPSLTINTNPDTIKVGLGWSDKARESSVMHQTPQSIKIGSTSLMYDAINVLNWKRLMQNDTLEGVFNIPHSDTTHVWELNFESNYLEIHEAKNFKRPENCFFISMKERYYVQLPMQIKCANNDTLTLNPVYFIDTGMPSDIALMYQAKELDFFNEKNDEVWTEYLASYIRSYTVKATISDNISLDSLRIYTFDYQNNMFSDYLIGQNFLKRFNVFFDMKNKELGLQPIKNFQRVVNPNHRRFHYSTRQTSEGNIVVKKVANYKNNYYKTAGLQDGDELITVNYNTLKN